MAASEDRTGSYLILLLLRSLAAAISIGCLYYVAIFLFLFFSGETGTELLIFAVPMIAVMVVAAEAVAAMLAFLTIWHRIPLRLSLSSPRRKKVAIILPILFGVVIAATTIVYFPSDEELNP